MTEPTLAMLKRGIERVGYIVVGHHARLAELDRNYPTNRELQRAIDATARLAAETADRLTDLEERLDDCC